MAQLMIITAVLMAVMGCVLWAATRWPRPMYELAEVADRMLRIGAVVQVLLFLILIRS